MKEIKDFFFMLVNTLGYIGVAVLALLVIQFAVWVAKAIGGW